MTKTTRVDWAHDLFLPTLLFAALGGMTWAVRGCSGYGTVSGCVFAGVMWGTAWWFLAREPSGPPRRRYASGWVVPALVIGVGMAGARGWMQWPHFFLGHMLTNEHTGTYVAIPKIYGFVWMFLAGVPWAGLGACLVAWCGSSRGLRPRDWGVRVACGVGGAALLQALFYAYPAFFLPAYRQYEDLYHNLAANSALRKVIRDGDEAMIHLGLYLGFLLFEIVRRDWKNVVLIATVGVVNGAGWALCQAWKWAPLVWPKGDFNYWRCWESSGGISIGVALGVAYFLVNRPMSERERAAIAARVSLAGPNFEGLLIYLGVTWSLGLVLREWLGGWGNLYFGALVLAGAAYYFCGRNATVAGELPDARPDSGFAPRLEPGAACLALALLVGLYLPATQKPRFGFLYLAVVMICGWTWYRIGREKFDAERARTTPTAGDPRFERFGIGLGLLTGLGISIRSGLKGWFNIYWGNEDYWSRVLWNILGPTYLAMLVALAAWTLLRPASRAPSEPVGRHAYSLIWLVLIVQNVLAQLITGPWSEWKEVAFSIYYLLLFFITATIVFHYHTLKSRGATTIAE